MDHLGSMLSHLGVMLGDFGAMLGLCWAILGPSWAHVGPCWAMLGHLGPSWAYVGPSWAILEPCWAYVGPMLGLCWAILGAILGLCWPMLAQACPYLSLMLTHVAHILADVGPMLAPRPSRCPVFRSGPRLKTQNHEKPIVFSRRRGETWRRRRPRNPVKNDVS